MHTSPGRPPMTSSTAIAVYRTPFRRTSYIQSCHHHAICWFWLDAILAYCERMWYFFAWLLDLIQNGCGWMSILILDRSGSLELVKRYSANASYAYKCKRYHIYAASAVFWTLYLSCIVPQLWLPCADVIPDLNNASSPYSYPNVQEVLSCLKDTRRIHLMYSNCSRII